MKVHRSFLVLFSLFCVAVMFSGLVFAQVRTVGVSEGDWFRYGFSFDWYSDDTNMTIGDDSDFDYLLEGEFVRFDVFDVSGSNVSGQFTISYENGTEEDSVGWVDVVTGEGEFSSWVISSGLVANDLTYASELGEMINETVMLASPLGLRETNHIEHTIGNVTDEDYYFFDVDMYWDREIGVLVEVSIVAETRMDENLTTASGGWELVESNVKMIPEFSPPALIVTFAAATVAVFAIKKRIANGRTFSTIY